MTERVISERLRTIASYCPRGAKVADIGSDHALLATYLLTSGIASYVVAGELNEGPYLAALRQIERNRLQERASVRRGDGLAVIQPGEVDAICIAGMGGQLIVSILERGKEKLVGVSRLILQPNVGEELVRRWLLANGWSLSAESILEEDQVIYVILVAEPGDPLSAYQGEERTVDELIRLGPWLWREKSPILAKKWLREREKRHGILKQLALSSRAESGKRMEEIQRELEWIDEVIKCLRTDKP